MRNLIPAFAVAALTVIAPHPAHAQARPVVAVFAHPDDERVIGPLLSRLAREGRETHLIIATDGAKGVRDFAKIPAGAELAAARVKEANCASKRLGVRQLHLLNLPDGGLASFDVLGKLRSGVAAIIDSLKPAVIITFGPEGGTGHPDHRLVGDVTTQIVQGDSRYSSVDLLYASLPTERLRTAPRADPTVNGMAEALLTVRVPFEEQDLAAGREEFACHRSQYTPTEMDAVNKYLAHAWNGTVWLRPWTGTLHDPGIFGPSNTLAQQSQGPRPFFVGNALGLPVEPATDRPFEGMSSNVKMFGALYSAESCSYDAERGLIVVPNRGVPQNVQVNNAWISFINHDGSVHTARWIGIQSPADRGNLTPPLVLNEPLGSDIANGMLYVADRDGGTTAGDPSVAVVRRFDMRTGKPAGEFRVDRSTGFNDIEVADDGTIYATQTGDRTANADPATWQVWKITPDGAASIFVQGAPLRQPNGIAFDPQGNIVVVNIGNTEVVTFSKAGQLVKTENAVQAGNDGLVIMKDGTKYVSSVINGGVSRIRPGKSAELIAKNIPSAASMCYDAGANQLVIPMNANNGLAFIRLE